MEYEIEGRCPKCAGIGKVMQDWARNVICDYKRYNFSFKIYYCDKHGVYVWRGRKHKIFDLSKSANQALSVEPLEKEVIKRFAESKAPMPTLSDYKLLEMTCPTCGKKWDEYGIVLLNKKTLRCPNCGAEISKEDAMGGNDS